MQSHFINSFFFACWNYWMGPCPVRSNSRMTRWAKLTPNENYLGILSLIISPIEVWGNSSKRKTSRRWHLPWKLNTSRNYGWAATDFPNFSNWQSDAIWQAKIVGNGSNLVPTAKSVCEIIHMAGDVAHIDFNSQGNWSQTKLFQECCKWFGSAPKFVASGFGGTIIT